MFAIEVAKEIQTVLAPKLMEDVAVGDDLFEDTFNSIEGAFNFVDPPLSFDILPGFISRLDDVYDSASMDLNIFEYLLVSCDSICISGPHSPILQIFDIDDEIAQPDSDRDFFYHNLDPIDERVSPATGDVETVDFGTEDQPRELKIGSPLSIDKSDRLIHLLISYLDVFAWSYEDMPVVEYLEWLANVVPVPKKDGKVRVCVDFINLNKASPKDDFPFPHIDLLVDSIACHSMLSFMDGFSGVMPFRLKNAGATYQRATTTLFHDMMHRDVEVYVDDMIVKSRGRADHLTTLERFFERIGKFRLRLNPKKCTFGVPSGKLLGHMVSEKGIEVDLDKIKAILDMPVPRTEKEIRGFLGRSRSTCFLSLFVPLMPGHPLLLYLSVSDMALGCMLAQLDDLGKKRAIYYLTLVWATRRLRHYMTEYSKSIKGSIVADHLAALSISEDRPVDDDFPDEEFIAMTSLSGWRMYSDGVANHSGFGIGVLLISPQGDHIMRSVHLVFSDRHPATNNIVEYEACILGLETALELGIRQMESRFAPAYYYLIGETKVQDDLPWYHDIYQFLRSNTYPEAATAKDRRALRQLATRFLICGENLYRRSTDGMLLLCLDRASADQVTREVHAGFLDDYGRQIVVSLFRDVQSARFMVISFMHCHQSYML
ncbi:Transposon Ty3-G Gag-Pol polyprotein [Vitis vinifera]|uniref:Transposon Ty3-G Gag-Pol polyprotein n=1 Tax=Vitis vinifera TaxID=29760 RepID=A0A438FDK5_VITVI|nr:Transposon Ty3-G Gag-Pol polyprotein [Vitis vinifera]